MGKLGYQAITLTDLTETLPISLNLQSNYSQNVQAKKDGLFVPDFTASGKELIITPFLQQGTKKLEVPIGDGTGKDPCIKYQVGELDSDGKEIDYYYDNTSNEPIYVDNKGRLHYKKNLSENLHIEAYIDEYQSKELIEHERIQANVFTILFLDEGSSQYTFTIDTDRDYYSEDQRGVINFEARLWKGADEISEGITYVWKKASNINWQRTTKKFEEARASVNSSETYSCTATYKGLSFSARKVIRDFTDDYRGTITADKNLILTPENPTIALTHHIWHGNTEINSDENDERFTYSWSVLKSKNDMQEFFTKHEKTLDTINVNTSGILPKEDFTIACKTEIKEGGSKVKATVTSFIDIKYSPVPYSVVVSPKTIFVPVKSNGEPLSESFTQSLKFQLINSETKQVLTYTSSTSSAPSLEDETGVSLNLKQTSGKWEFNGNLVFDFTSATDSFWSDSAQHSKIYEVNYTYLSNSFTEEFEIVKQFAGANGDQGYSGYTVDLSNEFHSFEGGEAVAVLGQKEPTCEISAFAGSKALSILKINARAQGTGKSYQAIYYPEEGISSTKININDINLFAEAKLSSENAGEKKVTITFTPGNKDNGEFLSKIYPIALSITVQDESGKSHLTFLKIFKYTINYNSKSYYLDFTENGKPCNEILYSKGDDSYSPSSFTVKAYSRDSATGVASEYTNGNIVYSVNGTTWTKLGTNGLIKDYSNLSKIYVRLYSAAAKDFSTSNLDNFSKYLLDQESIPILTDIKGYEFGGENLIKWSKTLPIESYKWSKTSDTNLTISQDGDFAVMNLYSNDSAITWRCFRSPKIDLLSEYIGKSFVFSCMIKVNSDVALDKVSFGVAGSINSGTTTRNCYKIFGTLEQNDIDTMKTEETWTTDKWIRIYKIFKLENLKSTDNKDSNNNALEPTPLEECKYFNILFYLNNNGNVQIKQPKLELGNVLSAWSASPYDIDFSSVSGTNLLSYGSSYRIDVYGDENGGYVDIPIGKFDIIGDYTFSWGDVINNYPNSSLKKFYIELYQTIDGVPEVLEYSKSYEIGANSFTKSINFSEGLIRIHAKASSSSTVNKNEHLIFYCLKAERGNIATPYALDNSQIANIVNIINDQGKDISNFDTTYVTVETLDDKKYITIDDVSEFFRENTGSYVTTDSLTGYIEAATNSFMTGNPEDSKYEAVAGYFQQIQRSVKIVTSGDKDAPYIQIGTNIGDQTAPDAMNFYTKITDNKLGFYENNTEVAYIGSESLKINKAHFLDSFIIGNEKSGELKVSVTDTGIGFLWEG